jgi:O-antigen/teichoic acid export membrane protein
MSQLTSYQRAMVLMTGSSLLVPLIGLATAPILAHSLGVAGRGEAGAALAPNLLIVGGATLGMPQALTYYLAKRPQLTHIALRWAALIALVVGVLTFVGVYLARPFLSGGQPGLAHLMLLGTLLALPALLVGLLQGAAGGRQMWSAVALERVINSTFRLLLLSGLALAGRLDVTSAVLVISIAPVVAGLAYLPLAAPPPKPAALDDTAAPRVGPDLLAFGSRVWLGAVATMLMARSSQLLVTPLSNVEQLGLLIVAITISDVPYIVTQTVQAVTFGTNSAKPDQERLLATSRVATLVAVAGSAALGLTLPLWIGFVFGAGFEAAMVPTWLLLVASCVSVPGLIAGAGLDSAGRPGLRSASLGLALIANVIGLLLLVPPLGAVGGALAALLSTIISTVFLTVAASQILHLRGHEFFWPRRTDLDLLRSAVLALAGRAGAVRRPRDRV